MLKPGEVDDVDIVSTTTFGERAELARLYRKLATSIESANNAGFLETYREMDALTDAIGERHERELRTGALPC